MKRKEKKLMATSKLQVLFEICSICFLISISLSSHLTPSLQVKIAHHLL